ncbi:MAG: 3-oxoacyl-[acyl-carrier-protein] reductase [Fimbriimonadaceae bacterium]
MRLEGQVALVTGASRGIGRAIAERLAEEGAHVVCVATSLERAAATADSIRANNRLATPMECDISDGESVAHLFKELDENFEPLSILVNNAGVTKDTLLMRMSEEDWDRVIDVNLKGTWRCIKHATKPMMKARYGRIVNISSIVGISGAPGQANYAASKAGIIGLTKSVAKELGSRGITCNAVAPGFIETEMTASLPEAMREYVEKTAPAGRLGSGEDIAGAVTFLCGPDSGYVTGQVMIVDGGLTL